MSIRVKLRSGILWSYIEKWGTQIASLLVFIVVARIIGPYEYGLASICLVYIGLISSFYIFIFDAIVSEGIHDAHKLSSAFWGIFGLGILLFLVGLGLAYILPEIFSEPELKQLMLYLSFLPIFMSTASLPTAIHAQKMHFKVLALRTIAATVVGGITGVAMATNGFGASAIVFQQITHYIVINLIIWNYLEWRPKFIFSYNEFKQIICPGLKSSYSNLTNFSQENLPKLIIGGFLSTEAVGFYSLAIRINAAIIELLFAPFSSVIFNVLSKLKGHVDEQTAILKEMLTLNSLILFPAVTGLISIADILITILFGSEWIYSIRILQLILLSAFAVTFSKIIVSVLRSQNIMAHYLLPQTIIVMLFLIISLILVHHGIIAITIAYTLCNFILLLSGIHILKRMTNFNVLSTIQNIRPVIFTSIIMFFSLLAIKYQNYYTIEATGFNLLLLIVVGSLIYVTIMLCFFRSSLALLEKYIHYNIKK